MIPINLNDFVENIKIKLYSLTVFICICASIFFISTPHSLAATYSKFSPGEAFSIGDFVYNDDYTNASTNCYISIWYPNNDSFVENFKMASKSANSWYYYNFPGSTTQGTWPAVMFCGTAGVDLIKEDKTFIIASASAMQSDIQTASSSLGSLIRTRASQSDINSASQSLNSQVLTRASLQDLETASSSLGSKITGIPAAVWAISGRTLSDFGSLVSDVTSSIWNALTGSLTTGNSIGKLLVENIDSKVSSRSLLSIQQAQWKVELSDFDRVLAGRTYKAKLQVLNNSTTPADPYSTPTVTLYDADNNTVVSNISMTRISAGYYEYTYSIPSNASQGEWETIVLIEVESGKTLHSSDYWEVTSSPAQVLINGFDSDDLIVPNIAANITISNEGLTGYEYHYEWCVVISSDNTCGGGDDIAYSTASKYINAGTDWNTTLTATVSTPGDYYFKLIVYYGTQKSGASRNFTAVSAPISTTTSTPTPNSNNSGGGGGGDGAFIYQTQPTNTPTPNSGCDIKGDFNLDCKVNSTDFSILLAFWKTTHPFKNQRVDINNDKKVNSTDFSIMLANWTIRR
jgi:hypothetical protein